MKNIIHIFFDESHLFFKKSINISFVTILILGLIARLIFLFFISKYFFGRENIFVDKDTYVWAKSFENLVNSGEYNISPGNEYGFFARMPGYSFFIGIFWLIIGNWEKVFQIVAYVQILLDLVSLWLIYKITLKIFLNNKIALISSFLYAFYPFIIVWNPVAYSESISIFLMLFSIFLFLKEGNKNIFLSGLILGIGALFRPQLLLLIPIFFFILFIKYKLNKSIIIFILSISISYGLWPIRNLLFHGKIILTQDFRRIGNWNSDVISFMQYVYSVKEDWNPQFNSIIKNERTEWPKISYFDKQDSILLDYAVKLSKTCGEGFSYWEGYWKGIVPKDSSCTDEICRIFNYLRTKQIKNNPFHFWIIVPLQNLKKAVFKSKLTDNSSFHRKLASNLFYYRTLLLFLGLLGCYLMKRDKIKYSGIFVFFFLFIYITLCFGTSPQMRNIEIRYFLHPDTLLIIPASYAIYLIRNFLLKKTNLKLIL